MAAQAGVAAIAASELEASHDHERRGQLDRAVGTLGEHGGIARELERVTDIAGRERDLGSRQAAIEVIARLGTRVLRHLDRAGALAGERASGREQDGDLRRRRGVERRLTVQLFEARQRGVEPQLHQVDRADDGTAACGEVTELATHARGECGAGQLGSEGRLAAQDLELGEVELGAQGPELVATLTTRAHQIVEQRRGLGTVTAATRDERTRGEHLVGDRDRIEVARSAVRGIERGGGFDEATFARETDRAARIDDRAQLARFEADRHALARAVGTR